MKHMNEISAYVLTKNSEKYLKTILDQIDQVVDEIIILDSGSNDLTKEIANSYSKVKWLYRELDNFRDQRYFAEKACSHDWILFLDCDEIPDQTFIQGLKEFKLEYPQELKDAYKAQREWNVLGKNVNVIFPIVSPDYPVRLYNRTKASFRESHLIHERPMGYDTWDYLPGNIKHITFETRAELNSKLYLYANVGAQDLIVRKRTINIFKVWFSHLFAYWKWYISKGGYKDGKMGIVLAAYARKYTYLKYKIALKEKRACR